MIAYLDYRAKLHILMEKQKDLFENNYLCISRIP